MEKSTVLLYCRIKQELLTRRSGRLNSPGINEFCALDYVYVDADVTLFQGQNQLNVKRIRKADEGEYHPADYLPVTTKDIPTMQHELTQYITTIKNEYLRKLASGYFNDPEFMKAFSFHSAAKSVHHGFVGGLLEHTLSVVKCAITSVNSTRC